MGDAFGAAVRNFVVLRIDALGDVELNGGEVSQISASGKEKRKSREDA